MTASQTEDCRSLFQKCLCILTSRGCLIVWVLLRVILAMISSFYQLVLGWAILIWAAAFFCVSLLFVSMVAHLVMGIGYVVLIMYTPFSGDWSNMNIKKHYYRFSLVCIIANILMLIVFGMCYILKTGGEISFLCAFNVFCGLMDLYICFSVRFEDIAASLQNNAQPEENV